MIGLIGRPRAWKGETVTHTLFPDKHTWILIQLQIKTQTILNIILTKYLLIYKIHFGLHSHTELEGVLDLVLISALHSIKKTYSIFLQNANEELSYMQTNTHR